jgi:hypothetical protein
VSRFPFAAAAAVFTFAAPAAMAGERSFTHEGVTYTYSITAKNKAQILAGRTSQGGEFRLSVKNGWVDGYVNDIHVSFRAPRERGPAQIAAR